MNLKERAMVAHKEQSQKAAEEAARQKEILDEQFIETARTAIMEAFGINLPKDEISLTNSDCRVRSWAIIDGIKFGFSHTFHEMYVLNEGDWDENDPGWIAGTIDVLQGQEKCLARLGAILSNRETPK